MQPILKTFLTLFCFWNFHLPLHAQESPCTADIAKFCANVPPGEQRLLKCLREHESELSVICRAASQAVKQQENQLTSACSVDIIRYCTGVRPGGGRIMQCLKENEAKLSPECKKLKREDSAKPGATPTPTPVKAPKALK